MWGAGTGGEPASVRGSGRSPPRLPEPNTVSSGFQGAGNGLRMASWSPARAMRYQQSFALPRTPWKPATMSAPRRGSSRHEEAPVFTASALRGATRAAATAWRFALFLRLPSISGGASGFAGSSARAWGRDCPRARRRCRAGTRSGLEAFGGVDRHHAHAVAGRLDVALDLHSSALDLGEEAAQRRRSRRP